MLNIIFEATLLTNFFKKDASRSGIFFVAQNILNELLSKKNVNVSLYFPPDYYAEGFRVKQCLYPNAKYAQDMTSYKSLCRLNCMLWRIHGKIYSHKILRKPIALGIVVSQRILKFLTKNKVDQEVFSSANVFFSPAYRIPNIIRKCPNIKPFVTLHDAIPILFPNLSNATFTKETCESIQETDGVFYVSNHTKRDFENLYPNFRNNDGKTIYLAAKNTKNTSSTELLSVKKKYNIPCDKKYVFSLCSLAPHKNLIRNLRSFNLFVRKNGIDDLVWIVGGGAFENFVKELNKLDVKFDSSFTKHIGYVDDEDLPVLYSNAEWFVYTSQYEGFGLPPLEAMQCGCPVIVSNNSSLPEVVGDAGILIDWDSDEQHVAAYEKYYFDKKFRDMKAAESLERAKLFSWEKTVDQMVEVMKGC